MVGLKKQMILSKNIHEARKRAPNKGLAKHHHSVASSGLETSWKRDKYFAASRTSMRINQLLL